MRLPLICSTLILTATSFGLVGCDQSSDAQLRDDVARSHSLVLAGTDESIGQAKQLLENPDMSSASLATRANAKALLAQIELEAARAAQLEIDKRMMDLSRLVAQNTQLANQIATANALVAGYRSYDPKEALADIQAKIADAQGGPDKAAWFTHENSQIPALAVLRQNISKLEGDLAQLQEKLAALQQQRQQVMTDADQAARESEGEQNEQTLAAFKRASDLRKQGADLATEIQGVEAAMRPLQKDLDIARAQAQIIDGVVKELEQEGQALQNGWQQIQKQMTAQMNIARGILEGGTSSAAPDQNIAAKAQQISKLTGELNELRQQAVDNARNATTHYGEAVGMADELGRDLGPKIAEPRPQRKGWQLMRQVMHPAGFRLNQAAAQRLLAQIYGSHAREMRMRIDLRNQLTPILQAGGLSLPGDLQVANLERELEQALTEANTAYKDADETLQNVTEGQAPDEVKNAAYVSRILTLYAWSQLNREAGNDAAAKEHLELAQQVRNTVPEGLTLPAMPAALAPPKPTTTEGTTDGSAPATAPAEGTDADTPATAPAEETPAPPAEPAPAEPAPAEPGPGGN